MMTLQERISAFAALGASLRKLPDAEFEALARRAESKNPWFTPMQVWQALQALQLFLQEDTLKDWVKNYALADQHSAHKVGVVMAGNIPAVGFHDALCVLFSGKQLLAKLSSQDEVLLPFLLEKLQAIAPAFGEQIHFPPLLKEADAFIATGSDNTARYFEYYFRHKPHIIRKNRVSVAVLDGQEQGEDFKALAADIFSYYGLGCRNVAKLYVPENYRFDTFFEAIEPWQSVAAHHKYFNNYEYNKAIFLIKSIPHLDNGFMLLCASEDLVSPTAILYFEYYTDSTALQEKLAAQASKIQCIVSRNAAFPQSIAFGQAQSPGLSDYADGIDTMRFLQELS
jgi:hypothetical protein